MDTKSPAVVAMAHFELEECDAPAPTYAPPRPAKFKQAVVGTSLISVFITSQLLVFTFLVRPLLPSPNAATLVVWGTAALALVMLLLLWHADPGVVDYDQAAVDAHHGCQAPLPLEALGDMETGRPPAPSSAYAHYISTGSICRQCRVWRPPMSHHCSICQRCVVNFDHHCGVLGRCIAERNHRWFVLLIMCAFVNAGSQLGALVGLAMEEGVPAPFKPRFWALTVVFGYFALVTMVATCCQCQTLGLSTTAYKQRIQRASKAPRQKVKTTPLLFCCNLARAFYKPSHRRVKREL